MFLGRQELAFRGHRGESGELTIEESNHNDGNFAAVRLRLKAGDTVLKNHLSSCGAITKYLSPMIQNEIFDITVSLITQKIVTKVKKCGLFSILTDESADVSAHEQLSIRFVIPAQNSCILMECFQGFVTVFDLTGEAIANSIETFCISVGLDLSNLVGIGLDGVSAMACKFKGVQACIPKSILWPNILIALCTV